MNFVPLPGPVYQSQFFKCLSFVFIIASGLFIIFDIVIALAGYL